MNIKGIQTGDKTVNNNQSTADKNVIAEPADNIVLSSRQTKLDRLYKKVDEAIAQLGEAGRHRGISS